MFLTLLLAAVQTVQPLPPGLLQADLNRDGMITRAEASAAAGQRFARFDADRNGSITPQERRQAVRAWRDRPLTAVEFQREAQARFARLDANRDGTLTAEERRGPRGMHGGRHGRGHDGNHRGMRGRGGSGDGAAVSAAQFSARALARFDRVDANDDGRVDGAEIAAIRTARRG